MANLSLSIPIHFDSERYMSDLVRRVALGSASEFENVEADMIDNIMQYVTIGEPKDILDVGVIE